MQVPTFARVENPGFPDHFIYVTPEFRKDVKDRGIHSRVIEDFHNWLKKHPDNINARLAKTKVFRKASMATWRFIYQEEKDLFPGENVTLLFLCRALKGKAGGDEAEYRRICYYPKEYGNELSEENKLEAALAFKEWRDSLDEAQKRQEEERRELKALELQRISQWLYGFHPKIRFDIYETKEWKALDAKKISRRASEFITLIEHCPNRLTGDKLKEKIPCGERQLFKAFYKDVCVVFEQILLTESCEEVLLLHFGAVGKDDGNNGFAYPGLEDAIRIATQGASSADERFSFRVEDGGYQMFEVSRAAERAYPRSALSINERDTWLDIQENKDDHANLSLLPSQVGLLENIRFPIFINGQAGSGKSTILFYLYSEILASKLHDDTPTGKIIFLTENEKLLEKTKVEIARILYLNPRYAEIMRWKFGKMESSQQLEPHVEPYFSTFKNFLLTKASPEDFPLDKYINFYAFKKEYNTSRNISRSIRDAYSAEVCWFVIRSLVKGYFSGEEFLPPERFDEVPAKDREKIDAEAYKTIFEQVYQRFYCKLEEQGYWDYISLVKAVMGSGKHLAEYSLLICDEAQDFTQVELELLISLSEFSNGYDLRDHAKFPVLFAGDPFQTVNPTGFSWSRLSSMFTDQIITPFKLNVNPSTCFEALHINYRSTPAIVRLANAIQFFRRTKLKEDELKQPQVARLEEFGDLPELLRLQKNLNEHRHLVAEIIVPPCELDEEETFRKADQLDTTHVINSPAMLKGLEEGTVVLYKFGQIFCDSFLAAAHFTQAKRRGQTKFESLCELLSSEPEDSNLNFRISYFFNKLYVAVTRARQRLIIADTDEGIAEFWEPLRQSVQHHLPKHEPPMLAGEFESVGWRKALLDPDSGTVRIYRESEPVTEVGAMRRQKDLLDKAFEALRQGIETANVDLLEKRAKPFFINAEMEAGASDVEIRTCDAYVALFNKEWSHAGDLFLSLPDPEKKMLEQAKHCFWQGGNWENVVRHFAEGSLERLTAQFMASGKLDDFNQLQPHVAKLKSLFATGELAWLLNLSAQFAACLRNAKDLPANQLEEIASFVASLELPGYELKSAIAECLYQAKRYPEACHFWDEDREADNLLYLDARAQSAENDSQRLLNLIALRLLMQKKRSPQADISAAVEKITYLLNTLPQDKLERSAREKVIEFYLSDGDAVAASNLLLSFAGQSDAYRLLFAANAPEFFANDTVLEVFLRCLLEYVDRLRKHQPTAQATAEINRLVGKELLVHFYQSPYFQRLRRPQYQSRLDYSLLQPLSLGRTFVKLIARSQLTPKILADRSFLKPNLVSFAQFVEAICEQSLLSQRESASQLSYEEMVVAFERASAEYAPVLELLRRIVGRTSHQEFENLFFKERWLKVKTKQFAATKDPEKKHDRDRQIRAWSLSLHFKEVEKEIAYLPEFPSLSLPLSEAVAKPPVAKTLPQPTELATAASDFPAAQDLPVSPVAEPEKQAGIEPQAQPSAKMTAPLVAEPEKQAVVESVAPPETDVAESPFENLGNDNNAIPLIENQQIPLLPIPSAGGENGHDLAEDPLLNPLSISVSEPAEPLAPLPPTPEVSVLIEPKILVETPTAALLAQARQELEDLKKEFDKLLLEHRTAPAALAEVRRENEDLKLELDMMRHENLTLIALLEEQTALLEATENDLKVAHREIRKFKIGR